MNDRILVLAAPARVALEEAIPEDRRLDRTFLAEIHARIARAMGGEEDA
jgi:NitT/TauT family transport system ATP-binding protein